LEGVQRSWLNEYSGNSGMWRKSISATISRKSTATLTRFRCLCGESRFGCSAGVLARPCQGKRHHQYCRRDRVNAPRH
jgi:hypothetical protein